LGAALAISLHLPTPRFLPRTEELVHVVHHPTHECEWARVHERTERREEAIASRDVAAAG
jgi:hypothetical protein